MADEKKLDGIDAVTGDFYLADDPRILGWVKEAVAEGENINRSDPAWPKMDEAMAYILGEQIKGNRPDYLPAVVINQTKKAIRTHVSALTDIKPLFAYRSSNPAFALQGDVLNKRIVAWWANTFADLELADVIKYACTAGAGDMLIEYDPNYLGGENRLIARDPRDTIPIRPSRSRTIQDWEGVILREAHSPNTLRTKYPDYADVILTEVAAGSSWGYSAYTRFRRRQVGGGVVTSTLDGLKSPATKSSIVPEVPVYRVYLKDRSRNLTTKTIIMGKPGTNWAYSVAPGELLYPRHRLILCTERAVFYDGPNPYWHAMFPVSRLRLDPWPWIFFGLGITHDLTPLQDGINRVVNDFLTNFSQAVNRGTIFDSRAVPEPVAKRFDARRPNWKMKVNTAAGASQTPFQLADPPQLPPWSIQMLEMLFRKHEDLSETGNLMQLMQLRQMPSGDTIEKYYNALTPGIRQESRLLEAFLREAAEMLKVNIFQFESRAKRVMLLGEAGQVLDDFDWDPETMIPAMKPDEQGYVPELDSKIPRDQRAAFFHKLLVFYVEPYSLLAMHAQERKMMYVQLARQGYLDFWTLMETLEVPNVGSPPPMPLPLLNWKPEEHLDAQGIPQPPPQVVRVPITVTERLQAQQMLGIGMTVSPVGRKASGEAPPKMEQKSDGRTTITESNKS